MAPDDDDRPSRSEPASAGERGDAKVKDLLEGKPLSEVVDAATARELERWFGLPSFEQLADQPPPPTSSIDPDVLAARERADLAASRVDPALLRAIHARTIDNTEALLKFFPDIEVRADAKVALIDLEMVARVASIAEPRELERPPDLEDHLKDCTPQALLRDLHRPETDFAKTFEFVDSAAEQRLDIVAEVAAAMKTSWKLPVLEVAPYAAAKELLDEVRALRRSSWPDLFAGQTLVHRRVEQ